MTASPPNDGTVVTADGYKVLMQIWLPTSWVTGETHNPILLPKLSQTDVSNCGIGQINLNLFITLDTCSIEGHFETMTGQVSGAGIHTPSGF